MTLETTDTNSDYVKKPIPDGEYTFTVIYVERVEKVPGLYEWQFSCSDGQDYEVGLFKTEMGGLLRVLGFQETEKGKFTWDTVDAEKKSFVATAYQVADKKDPSIMRQKLKDFKTAPAVADAQAVAKNKGSGLPF